MEEVCLASVMETLVGCGTCYLNRFFTTTRYEKQLERIAQYIDSRNKNVFIPSGLFILDPKERGLRVVSLFVHDTSPYINIPSFQLEISLLATGQVCQPNPHGIEVV